MDDPLSSSIGNSLEVETVVEILLGENKNEKALWTRQWLYLGIIFNGFL